jgi:hypothetical protein
LIDAGRDVVAVTRHDGTGRASGVTVEDLVADVVTVEDGTLVRIRCFQRWRRVMFGEDSWWAADCGYHSRPMSRGVKRGAQAMFSPLAAWLRRPRVRGSARSEREATEFDERGIPVPPLRLRGLVSGQGAVEEWLRGSAQDACLIRELVERHNGTMSEMGSILDFGCGCGRVARWWGDLHGPAIFGNDYDADMTSWCQENLPGIAVKTNGQNLHFLLIPTPSTSSTRFLSSLT